MIESISIEGFAAIGLGAGFALFLIGALLGWMLRWAWDAGDK